jgi:hypothetical protein
MSTDTMSTVIRSNDRRHNATSPHNIANCSLKLQPAATSASYRQLQHTFTLVVTEKTNTLAFYARNVVDEEKGFISFVSRDFSIQV